jgi:hypothetical protein
VVSANTSHSKVIFLKLIALNPLEATRYTFISAAGSAMIPRGVPEEHERKGKCFAMIHPLKLDARAQII